MQPHNENAVSDRKMWALAIAPYPNQNEER